MRPGRARHGMRRGRALLQRLRGVVRGRRDGGPGREARVGCDAGSTGQPGAIRPVRKALPGAALKRPGRATSARAPAAVGVAPPTHSNLVAHVGGTIVAEVVSS